VVAAAQRRRLDAGHLLLPVVLVGRDRDGGQDGEDDDRRHQAVDQRGQEALAAPGLDQAGPRLDRVLDFRARRRETVLFNHAGHRRPSLCAPGNTAASSRGLPAARIVPRGHAQPPRHPSEEGVTEVTPPRGGSKPA